MEGAAPKLTMLEEAIVAPPASSEIFPVPMPKTEEGNSFPAVAVAEPTATTIYMPPVVPLLPVEEVSAPPVIQPEEIPPNVPFCEETAGSVMMPVAEQQPQSLPQELPELVPETPTGKRARPKKPKSAAKTSKSKTKKEAADSWMDGEALSPTGADANDEVSISIFCSHFGNKNFKY